VAFDLVAKLKLQDNFSDKMRRIEKATQRAKKVSDQYRDSNGRLRDSMVRFSKESDRATKSIGGFSGKAGGALRGLGSLQTAFLGIAGAIGGAAAAHKIFESTIGEAAKYEQSQVMIESMFDNEKAAKAYTEMVNKFAIDSPIMDSQTMFSSSKSFITASKDIKELEQMWSLAERLAATDPAQGLDGAVFALRELFSGDAISIQRRFEMGGKEIDKIKAMKLPDQLKALDRYFTKIGLSQKLIDRMGTTTLGVWQQIKEQVAVTLRDMGAPALRKIKEFLIGINDGVRGGAIDGFKVWGTKVIESMTSSTIEGIKSVTSWVQSIQNDPEFKKQTTLYGKVKFVIDDIYKNFLEWLDNGGKDKITQVVSGLFQVLVAAIDASMGVLGPVAIKVGTALGAGIVAGFNEAINDSTILRLLKGGVMGSSDDNKSAKGFAQDFLYNKGVDMFKDFVKGKSHSAGLSNVPYNGYSAVLHKSERVLTAEEAKVYNRAEAKGGLGGGVTINVAKMEVRKDSDIKAVAYELARLIESESAQMAY
jgi:hypothetical protein